MNQSKSQTLKTLQSAYDEQYTDEMTEWRELGGKYKAQNILKVCRNHQFEKVLDCGAGEGSILKYLSGDGAFRELHAIEISDTGLDQIQKRKLQNLKQAKKFNGYEIPYSDNEFDMAYCSHVIEHVEHPRTLLREIGRVSEYQVFEIPLDYSNDVDEKIDHFLSYGHINIYTPSLFKFLLKSEGYEIADELLTHTQAEVVRFNWYVNRGLDKTFNRELGLRLRNFKNLLKRIRQGKKHYMENGFSAYTCLAKACGRLEIF